MSATTSTKKRKTKADLQREIVELKAQLASTYHFADATLDKAGTKFMMGSGVLLQMHGLGGRAVINPVVIRDGLSDETIAALKKDIVRSYETAVIFKPKGVTS